MAAQLIVLFCQLDLWGGFVKKLIAVLITVLICPVVGSGSAIADEIDLQLTRVSTRETIFDIANADDGSGRLFLVDYHGQIFIIDDGQELPTPFLDIQNIVNFGEFWQGLISLAFAPDYMTSGFFYVWFTNSADDMVLARFKVSNDPNIANANSRETIMTVAKSKPTNTAGRIRFGPDGMLYLSLGDDGDSDDYSNNNGQDGSNLLGKLMRIDVDPMHGTYAIPADNPFVGNGAVRDEIWALGLRNPWKISFDRGTGDLFISDTGPQSSEINFQFARSTGGENYGWNTMEGSSCVLENCNQAGLTMPVVEYTHNGNRLVIGGEVYRGNAYPNLKGVYLYGDHGSNSIWGLTRNGDQWISSLLSDASDEMITFGLGEDGSVYVANWGIGVHLISDGEVKAEPSFVINAGHSGAWYNPVTSGQGQLIDVVPETQFMFLAWFTFTAAAS